ncbi:hypothetical protein WHR41_05189 [Cladosporium halotolerans]|uniref:Telomeric single stranded DNA binding POT1/Cdc13 domain-containing protein n=1 Tax=Cladosporium halotolerans TaxID=1052096 RepID=A0AB34KN34_9PEZI
MSTTIPIQDLDTTTNPPADRTIHAVVTLVWPYSSSTRQCALLLSELDFRLRAKGGQVRVKFSGPSARAVAGQRLGIGDQVILGLKGGDWVRDEGGIAVRVPGKSVGELQFGRGLQLKVQKDGVADAEINVSEDAMDDVEEETRKVPTTPAAKKRPSGTGFRSSVGSPPASAAIYSSPAFVKRMAEFSYLDGLSRLFEEELDDQNGPRKKARISIGDVKDWKVVDRTPSPEVPTADPDTGDNLEVAREALQAGSDGNEPAPISSVERPIKDTSTALHSSESAPAPEPLRFAEKESTGSVPQLQFSTASPAAQPSRHTPAAEESVNPLTPRLLPVASSALPSTTPQISPLTARNIVGEPSEIAGVRSAENRPQEATSTLVTVEQRGLPAASELQNAPEVVVEDDSATNASEFLLDPARSDLFVDQAGHEEDHMADERRSAMDTPAVQSNIPDNELDENMSDAEEEDDEMFMNEQDAEDVFDADALEGEEPSDDDTNENLEMHTMADERQEFVQSSVEDSDIESELEEAQAAQEQLDDETDQPGQAIAEEEASQPPVFKPASTLLQEAQTPIKQPVGKDVNEGVSVATPTTKPSQDSRSEQLTTVATPAAKSPDTPKRTPQSAHDRVMKRTLQSLFGLKGTPSPEKEDLAATKAPVEAKAEQQAIFTTQDVAEDPRSMHDEPQIEDAEKTQEGTDETPEASSQKAQEEPVEVIELASSSDEEDDAPLPADEMAESNHNVVSEPTPSTPMPQQRKAPEISAPVHETLQELVEDITTEAASIAQQPAEPEDVQPVARPRSEEAEMKDNHERHQIISPEGDAAVGTPEIAMVEAEGVASVPEPSGTEAPLAEFMEVEETRPAEAEISDLETSKQEQMTEQEVQLDEPELFQPPLPAKASSSLPAEDTPEQPAAAHGATTEISEAQQREVISSPTSFHSQLKAEASFDQTQRQQGLETSSRPASRDTMEGFSPVALGSLSREVLGTNGNNVAEGQAPDSISTHEVGQPSNDAHPHGRLASEADNLIPDETRETPSRTVNQTEVIELESSPSEMLSLVNTKQSEHMQELTPQQSSFEDKQESFVYREEVVQREEQTPTEVPEEQLHTVQTSEQGTAVDVQRTSHLDLPPTPSLSQPVKAETLLPEANEAQAPVRHLPLTPQGSSKPQLSSQLPSQAGLNGRPTMDTEMPEQQENQEAQSTQPAQQPQPKTPARRSLRTRLSNVPDVISAWFSPKRSSIAAAQEASKEQDHSPDKPITRAPEPEPEPEPTETTNPPPPAEGLSTPHAYFTPLSALPQHLNPSTPQTLDVLAVVTTAPKPPERAKAGPRDYFTSFRVADPSLPLQQPASSVRVEVFRPWKAVLPAAEAGDVVLLRAFAVKSRKRRAFLLSCDASAWCVWRFGEVGGAVEEEEEKIRRRSSVSGAEVREEVKGPPVEFGEAERERAGVLRGWWVGLRGKEDGGEAEGEEERGRDVEEDEEEEV